MIINQSKCTMKTAIILLFSVVINFCSQAQGKISAGLNNAMGICHSDSVLWSWGYDHIGHNNPNYLVPNPVWSNSNGGQLQKVISVSTAYTHAIATLSDGTVWAWGMNTFGQLGDSLLNSNTNYPVQMRGESGFGYLDSIIEVSCGYYHSLMLKSDGTVLSCGYNNYGQLGLNSTQSWSVPKQVLGPGGIGILNNIIQIDAGSHSSVALRNDGTVWTWGSGAYGTMGSGSGNNYFPEQVPGLPQITKISIKGGHVLALDTNGNLWSWGENLYGQVGNNTFSHVYSPVQVLDDTGNSLIDSIVEIGTGMMHSFAIHSNGKAYAWGSNNNGQLGDGTTLDRYYPVPISGPNGNGLLNNVVEIEGGHLFTVARKADNTVYCWGDHYTSYPEIINGICSTLSSEQFISNQINLYPNPLDGNSNLIISLEENINILSIHIVNTSGQILLSFDQINENHISLDNINLKNGVYLVSIETNVGTTAKRLIIQ